MAGRSGYPNISGRVFRAFKISGFENWNPKFAVQNQNPTFRVPDISGSGSGLPYQPEMQLRRQPATDPLNKYQQHKSKARSNRSTLQQHVADAASKPKMDANSRRSKQPAAA